MKFFEKPTQVKFYDSENECWLGGIAYGDVIICGCCGSILEIADFENPDKEIKEYPKWLNISEEIIGE